MRNGRTEGKTPRVSIVFLNKWKNNKGVSRKLYWNKYKLGIWFEKDKVLNIEKKSTGMAVNEIYTEKAILDQYMIGIWLLVAEIRLFYIKKSKNS